MHFRESGKRIQCLASVYDAEKKGGRQVLAWSISTAEAAAVFKVRPKPEDLLAGTPEQRARWSKEICDFMEERDRSMRSNAVIGSLQIVEGMVDMLVEDARSENPTMSEDDIKRLNLMIRRWTVKLHPINNPQARPKPVASGDDPRAFDTALIDTAKAHRAAGLSIAATADKMTADGTPVSRSWVQKWTS